MLLILIPGIKARPLSIYGGFAFALYLISRLFKEPLQHTLTPVPALSEIPALLKTFLAKIPILSKISSSKPPILSEIPIFTETSPLSNALFVSIIVFIMFFKFEFGLDFYQSNLLLISFGIMGALGTEFWRRRHRYYITNLRIVTECMGKRRGIFYDRISDLIIERSIFGWIFNFGSIIPLTGSGIGTGMDISLIGAGVGKSVKQKLLGVMFGGGKTISTPRARSPYILYGIPNPKREYKRITGLMLGLPEEGRTEIEDLDSLKVVIISKFILKKKRE